MSDANTYRNNHFVVSKISCSGYDSRLINCWPTWNKMRVALAKTFYAYFVIRVFFCVLCSTECWPSSSNGIGNWSKWSSLFLWNFKKATRPLCSVELTVKSIKDPFIVCPKRFGRRTVYSGSWRRTLLGTDGTTWPNLRPDRIASHDECERWHSFDDRCWSWSMDASWYQLRNDDQPFFIAGSGRKESQQWNKARHGGSSWATTAARSTPRTDSLLLTE